MQKNIFSKTFVIVIGSLLVLQFGIFDVGLYTKSLLADSYEVTEKTANNERELRRIKQEESLGNVSVQAEENGKITPQVGDLPNIQVAPPASSINLRRYFHVISGKDTFVSRTYPQTVSVVGLTSNQRSAIWAGEKLDLTRRGTARSSIYLQVPPGDLNSAYQNAGDGMTLTFHNATKGISAIGGIGQGLGVYKGAPRSNEEYVNNGIAFELDLYPNTRYREYDKGFVQRNNREGRFHAAFVDTDEISDLGYFVWNTYQTTHKQAKPFNEIPGMLFGKWVQFDYDWTPSKGGASGVLDVNFAGTKFSLNIDNVDATFGTTPADRTVYWGYTASTGTNRMIGAIAIQELPQQADIVTTVQAMNKHNVVIPKTTGIVAGQKLVYDIMITERKGEGAYNDLLWINVPNELTYLGNLRLRKSNGTEMPIKAENIIIGNNGTITIKNMEPLSKDTYHVRFDAEVKAGYDGRSVIVQAMLMNGRVNYIGDRSTHSIVPNILRLAANDIALRLNEAQTISEADLLMLTQAAIITDVESLPPTVSIAQTEIAKLTGLTEIPREPVEIVINGSDTIVSTHKAVNVYIYDEVNLKDKEALNAHGFEILLSLVSEINFIERAAAKAYDTNKLPGQEVGGLRVISVLPTTDGKHPVTFTFRDGKTERTVMATVIDDVAPISEADARIIYDKGTAKTCEEFLADVHAALNETGTITSDFEAVVDMHQVGTYVVTIQGQDTAGNKANTVQTIVLVADEDTFIDEDEDIMMQAHDFNIKLSEVLAADFLSLAEAQAWRISTTEPIVMQLESAKPTTGGVHHVTFSAGKTTKTVTATVLRDVRTIVITGADVRLSIDEFDELRRKEKLEETILTRANVRAIIVETDEELAPVRADIRNLLAANLLERKEYNVELYYEEPVSIGTFATDMARTGARHTTMIKVAIDDPLVSVLPVTGENIMLILLMSFITLVTSFIILFRKRIFGKKER